MQSISDFWAQIMALVGFIIWLARLEMRAKATAEDRRGRHQRGDCHDHLRTPA